MARLTFKSSGMAPSINAPTTCPSLFKRAPRASTIGGTPSLMECLFNSPTSQQPKSQSKNESGWEYVYETVEPGGKKGLKSVQQQTLDSSHKDQPHWESGNVKKDDWGNPRYNQYGRTKLESDKSKVYYKKR